MQNVDFNNEKHTGLSYVLCYRNTLRAGRLSPLTPLLELARHGHRAPPTGPHTQNCPTGFWFRAYRPAQFGCIGLGCRCAVAVDLGKSGLRALPWLTKIEPSNLGTPNTPAINCACRKEYESGLRS